MADETVDPAHAEMFETMVQAMQSSYTSLALLKLMQSDEDLEGDGPERLVAEGRLLVNYVLNHWDELVPPASAYMDTINAKLDAGIERALQDAGIELGGDGSIQA